MLTEKVQVRTTAEEKQAMLAAATREGRTLSDWSRRQLVGAALNSEIRKKRDSTQDGFEGAVEEAPAEVAAPAGFDPGLMPDFRGPDPKPASGRRR